jgi:hypothetical protein
MFPRTECYPALFSDTYPVIQTQVNAIGLATAQISSVYGLTYLPTQSVCFEPEGFKWLLESGTNTRTVLLNHEYKQVLSHNTADHKIMHALCTLCLHPPNLPFTRVMIKLCCFQVLWELIVPL